MSKKSQKKIKRKPHIKTQIVKNQPLSKLSKLTLIICAAVLVLGGALFAIFYNDGSLPVKNGVIQSVGDNWVIINRGSSSKPKYYKLAEVTAAEGYARDTENTYKTDKNVTDFIIKPDNKENPIDYYYISGVNKNVADMVTSVRDSFIGQYGEEGISDIQNGIIGEYESQFFFMKSSSKDDAGKSIYTQQLICYLPVSGNASLLLSITVSPDDENGYLDESMLMDAANSAAKGIDIIIE